MNQCQNDEERLLIYFIIWVIIYIIIWIINLQGLRGQMSINSETQIQNLLITNTDF